MSIAVAKTLYAMHFDEMNLADSFLQEYNTNFNASKVLMENDYKILAVVVPVESTQYNAKEKLESIGVPLISHTRHGF